MIVLPNVIPLHGLQKGAFIYAFKELYQALLIHVLSAGRFKKRVESLWAYFGNSIRIDRSLKNLAMNGRNVCNSSEDATLEKGADYNQKIFTDG